MNIKDTIVDNVIAQMEEGIIPWNKPYSGCRAMNHKTKKYYRGINYILLQDGEFLTFNQIKELGGKVKKGAKSSIIIKYVEGTTTKTMTNVKTGIEEDVEVDYRTIRKYNVFNVYTQVEGIQPHFSIHHEKRETDTDLNLAQDIVLNYLQRTGVVLKEGNAAFYSPSLDRIEVLPVEHFINEEHYYSTLYHEMIHSTGLKNRLNRGTLGKKGNKYSFEELVAEIGASMLSSISRINPPTIEKNTIAYLQFWIGELKNDKNLLFKAAAAAQKAVDYILEGLEVNTLEAPQEATENKNIC